MRTPWTCRHLLVSITSIAPVHGRMIELSKSIVKFSLVFCFSGRVGLSPCPRHLGNRRSPAGRGRPSCPHLRGAGRSSSCPRRPGRRARRRSRRSPAGWSPSRGSSPRGRMPRPATSRRSARPASPSPRRTSPPSTAHRPHGAGPSMAGRVSMGFIGSDCYVDAVNILSMTNGVDGVNIGRRRLPEPQEFDGGVRPPPSLLFYRVGRWEVWRTRWRGCSVRCAAPCWTATTLPTMSPALRLTG